MKEQRARNNKTFLKNRVRVTKSLKTPGIVARESRQNMFTRYYRNVLSPPPVVKDFLNPINGTDHNGKY